jgi:dCTP deaminase
MILTDHTITAEINNGNIVIEPFNPDNLGTNSYDLTLSNSLVLYTESVLDVRKKNLSAPMIIPPEGLILQPNIIYLASTVEYTETLRHVPVIQGKSSLRKIRIICPCDCWLWRCRI